VDPAQIRSLADIVQLGAVQRGLRYLAMVRKAKLLAAEIAKLLAFVAKDYVGAPATDVDAIKGMAARLRGKRRGLCQRVRQRLIPLKHEPNLAKLFLLPIGLTRSLSRKPSTSVADARLYQCALALALLTVCPLRIGALCSIRLDRHLSWSVAPMKGDLIIEFASGELKGDEAGSFPIPRDVAGLIRVYCERFRPLLTPRGSPFLFCGIFPERPRSKTGFSTQLSQLIFDRLGLWVNPHLYRHLVHLVVLRRFPAAYAMVARVLTHRSINTTIQNYSYLDGEISMRAYQHLVEGVQQGRWGNQDAEPWSVAYAVDSDEGGRHVRT
jgi:integrase